MDSDFSVPLPPPSAGMLIQTHGTTMHERMRDERRWERNRETSTQAERYRCLLKNEENDQPKY